ncbi:MAG: hypothetical protein VX583_12630 [Bdellovibrionota bacterium]
MRIFRKLMSEMFVNHVTVVLLSVICILTANLSHARSISYKPYALKEFSKINEKDYSFSEKSPYVLEDKFQKNISEFPLEFTADLENIYSIEYFNNDPSRHEKSAKINYSLDPQINWIEFQSRLNQSNRLLAKLISCSSKEDYKKYYFEYEFLNCPDLKDKINNFRHEIASFLINTQFTSFNLREFYSLNIFNRKNILSDSESEVLLNSISQKDIEYKERNKDNKKLVSSFFRSTSDSNLEKIDINPLLVQILIELSSLLVVGENSEGFYIPAFSTYEKNYDFFVSSFSFPKYYELIAFYDQEINPAATYVFTGLTESNFELIESSYRKAMRKRGSKDRESALREADVRNQIYLLRPEKPDLVSGSPMRLLGQEFKQVARLGIFSLRFLAELSMVLKKEDFGFLPKAYHEHFAYLALDNRAFWLRSKFISKNHVRLRLNDELPVPSLAKWIAGISGEYTNNNRLSAFCKSASFSSSCQDDYEVLGLLNHLRFYVEKSFPDIRNIREDLL